MYLKPYYNFLCFLLVILILIRVSISEKVAFGRDVYEKKISDSMIGSKTGTHNLKCRTCRHSTTAIRSRRQIGQSSPTTHQRTNNNGNGKKGGVSLVPEFTAPIGNFTVIAGSDVVFTCAVKNLGDHQVSWIHVDKRSIVNIYHHVIINNPDKSTYQVPVSLGNITVCQLNIKRVQEKDSGLYMCQIVAESLIIQVGFLDVVIPPVQFSSEETSNDTYAREGTTVKLQCKAPGNPSPSIQWIREDGQDIVLKMRHTETQAAVYKGRVLELQNITRAHNGTYRCIATYSFPPSIFKRITLLVFFRPVAYASHEIVKASLYTDIVLECDIEAYPISYQHMWMKEQKSAMLMVTPDDRHRIQHVALSIFEVRMVLIILSLRRADVDRYHCIVKNTLGYGNAIVEVSEMRAITEPPRHVVRQNGSDDNWGVMFSGGSQNVSNTIGKKVVKHVATHWFYPMLAWLQEYQVLILVFALTIIVLLIIFFFIR